MKNQFIQLSIILPTYNESGNISGLIEKIIKIAGNLNIEIIIVDDSSPDNTADLIKNNFRNDKRINVIIRKERGLAGAIFRGLKKAKGKFIVVMDTDFNHDPSEIRNMLASIENHDLVIGSRYVKGGGMENKIRNFLSKNYNFLIRLLLNLPVHDALSGFFMIREEKLKLLLKKYIFEGYGEYFIRFLHLANKNKMRITEIPVFYKNRTYGISKSQFMNMFADYSKVILEIYKKSKQ